MPETAESFARALADVGAGDASLSAGERAALDGRGFVVLRDVVERPALEPLRATLERALASAGEGPEGTGTRHLGSGPPEAALLEAVLHPRVLAAAHHVLGRPFRLHTASARDPRPGFGLQGLHRDWLPRAPGEPYAVVTTLLLLDAFTHENGATRVVPGSHVEPGPVPRALGTPDARHPREERVVAHAGAALVLNGHLLHAGTRNASSGTRRVLQLQLVARDRVRPGSADGASRGPLPERLRFLTS